MKMPFTYHYLMYMIFALTVFQKAFSQVNQDSLFNVASVYIYDNPKKAIEISDQLFELNPNDLSNQIDALLLKSNAFTSLRDYEKSLEFALLAEQISSRLKNDYVHLKVLSSIAVKYHELGVNDKTLEILDRVDLLGNQIENKDTIRFVMGNSYAIRGFVYKNQLSCEIAIDYFNRAAKAYSVYGNERSYGNQSVVAYNKGNCFVMLNQLDSAKQNFILSENLAKKHRAKSLQAFALKGLAEVYTLESQNEVALNKLMRANDLAKDVGDLVLNRGINKGMSDNYLALHDWEKFQTYFDKYQLNESQIKLSERKTIHNILNNHYETIEAKKKAFKFKYGMAIFVASLLLIVIVVWMIRSEIKVQKKLNSLKSKIKL